MKTKNVKKQLQQHKNTFTGNIDVDLYAFREKYSNAKDIQLKTTSFIRSYWLLASALLVIILMAITVPVTIVLLQPNLNENVEQQSFYCSSEDINNEIIDDIESYLAQNNYKIKSINSNVFFAGYVQLSSKEANKPIGILAEVLVFDEDLEEADVISYIDNYIIINL